MSKKKDKGKNKPPSTTRTEESEDLLARKDLTSRRKFLTKSALAAGGLVVLPSTVAQRHEAIAQRSGGEIAQAETSGNLLLQIPEEIKKAEGLLHAMEKDAALRRRFVTTPATVLAERGLVTSETPASISNANKIFLGMVTNNKLMAWIEWNSPLSPPPPEVSEIFRKWAEEKGPLDIPPHYVASVVKEFARNERFMKSFIPKLIKDPAVGAALPAGIGQRELITLVTAGMREAARGAAAGTLPRLEAAGPKFGPSIVAGQARIAFVFIPVWVFAVIVIGILCYVFVFVAGPNSLSLSPTSIRPILRDLSVELCGLTPGRQ